MMITTKVRHRTHFDLTTCNVCFVTHMMIMRQYFHRLWYDPYHFHTHLFRSLCLHFGCMRTPEVQHVGTITPLALGPGLTSS